MPLVGKGSELSNRLSEIIGDVISDDADFVTFLSYGVNTIYNELTVENPLNHIQNYSEITDWSNISQEVKMYILIKCQAGDPTVYTIGKLRRMHLDLLKNYLTGSAIGCYAILRWMLEVTAIWGYVTFHPITNTAKDYCEKACRLDLPETRFPFTSKEGVQERMIKDTAFFIGNTFYIALHLFSKWKKGFQDILNAIENEKEALSKVNLDKNYLNGLYSGLSKKLHGTFEAVVGTKVMSPLETLMILPSVDLDSLKYTREYIIKVLDAILCFNLSMKCRYWGYEDVEDYIRALELEKYQTILRNLEYAKPGQRLEKFTNLFHSARTK